jgi:hypothetical protein
LRDAILFERFAAEAGFETTRVPDRGEVKVGDIDSAAWAVESPLGARTRPG